MMQTDNQAFQHEFDRCRERIEKEIGACFIIESTYKTLLESMRYSLLAGGKRIRGILCMKFSEAVSGGMTGALRAACAIEMLHTYSLIHDDLPCMDDDDMRRGLPSNHIKYGEFTATLAGDALQAAAFEMMLLSELPPAVVVEMGKTLARAAGPHGICGGQYLDMLYEGSALTQDTLDEINNYKTAALISASAEIGVIAAGGSQEQLTAAKEYARHVGLAFQIRDDLLDYTATEQVLGKPILSDEKRLKTTYASLFDAQSCEKIINEQTALGIAALSGKFEKTDFLVWLAHMLSERKY